MNEPGVLRETLRNGLRVIIVHNSLAPVVTTVVNYQVGADEAPSGFPGMADALEHMMFRGSPGLSADQLDEVGAMLGGNFDAQTQSNGLKLIVQPESVSNTVCVYSHIKNEPKIETKAGKDGVDEVLEELLTFGTQSLNRQAFEKALDEIGATESPGADFSLQVLSKDFDRGMELLADNEISPALPEKTFA